MTKAMKTRDLDELTANMRKSLTWSDIDKDIAEQPQIKLPDRRPSPYGIRST